MITRSGKRQKKVTIKDVLDEAELELLGIKESVDGFPVSSSSKRSEFLEDCGMWEDPILLEIQVRYRGKERNDEEREKYLDEVFDFINGYFHQKIEEYLASQKAI